MCAQRNEFVASSSNCLVLGGPGSGKTTIGLIKSEADIKSLQYSSYQRILFLSFARATISRVAEASQAILSNSSRPHIEINTYHGFCWSILKSHGYLIGLSKSLKLLSPGELAGKFADLYAAGSGDVDLPDRIQSGLEELAYNEFTIAFDLFAKLAARILSENPKLAKILSERYPCIILDEFQDTDSNEWKLIEILGSGSRLIALADPDQRIYEFRGADPKRVSQFAQRFSPKVFDFGSQNNRSSGTDITQFGNDLLLGINLGKKYKDVVIKPYRYTRNYAFSHALRLETKYAISRLSKGKKQWTLAILVPTKRLMVKVSDSFRISDNDLLPIRHTIAIDHEGPTLAARIIALLLEPVDIKLDKVIVICEMIHTFFGGKGGSRPTKKDLQESKKIETALRKFRHKPNFETKGLLTSIVQLINTLESCHFVGDPETDRKSILNFMSSLDCPRLRIVAQQASYVTTFNKGRYLREALAETWRTFGSYRGALHILDSAFLREHFTATQSSQSGVVVMNMHKAKGKEFDEVIIFEDEFARFCRDKKEIEQSRINLRVSVTRAKIKATILTPLQQPSILLFR